MEVKMLLRDVYVFPFFLFLFLSPSSGLPSPPAIHHVRSRSPSHSHTRLSQNEKAAHLRPLDAQRLPNPFDGVLALASILQHALEHAPHGRTNFPPLPRGLGPAVPRAVDLGPLALPDLLRVAGAQVREAGLEGGFLLLEGGDGGAEVGGGEGGCEGLEGGAQGFEGGEEGGGFGC